MEKKVDGVKPADPWSSMGDQPGVDSGCAGMVDDVHRRGLNWLVERLLGRGGGSKGKRSDAVEAKDGFAGVAGEGEVDVEVGAPIVEVERIDEHLLDVPMLAIVGGADVGVLKIAGGGIETEAVMFHSVGGQSFAQTIGGPWFAIG